MLKEEINREEKVSVKEVWKDIHNYEGCYQISSFGRVKSLDRTNSRGRKLNKRLMRSSLDSYGYRHINLYKNGTIQNFTIHRLVARTFIENLENKEQINHKDGDKQNNNVVNLEWATSSENIRHSFDKLNRPRLRGVSNAASKLTEARVKEIKRLLTLGNLTQKEIGAMFGVTHSNISAIKLNKSWEYIL